MILAEKIPVYARDFLPFKDDIEIPSAVGPARLGDVEADFQREAFAALAPNLSAVARGRPPASKFHFWERTKGASKDSDCAVACLWALSFGAAGRPVLIQCGANDQMQADELRRATRDILLLNPLLSQILEIRCNAVVNVRTESRLEILASDAASAHGSRPNITVINELSHISKENFALTMADNSAKIAAGLMLVATNAGVLGSWQDSWRENASTSPLWSYHKVSIPAPWISERDLSEAKRRNPPSRFARLWEGAWVASAGDAIAEEDLQAALVHAGQLFSRPHGHGITGGLDLSQRRDWSALVLLCPILGTGRVRVAKVQTWSPGPGSPIDLETIRRAILRAREQFDLRVVYCDMWQANHLQQLLATDGIYIEPTSLGPTGQSTMASALLRGFRDRIVELYPDERLLADLRKMSIVERVGSGGSGLKLEAPRDATGHADAAFAFAAALPSALEVAARPASSWQPITPLRLV